MKLSSSMARGLAAVLLGVIAASCGARSGLFGVAEDDPTPGVDAAADRVVDTSVPDVVLDAPPDVVPCIPGRFDFELATPQLMFVIDRSGSMNNAIDNDQPAPPGTASRWTVLRDSLGTALAPLDGQLSIGAKFYPEAPEDDIAAEFDGCLIDKGQFIIPPARNNASKLQAVFQTRQPLGGTPTAEALAEAADLLGTQRGVARTIVLATDGAPNCNDNLNPRACVCTSPVPQGCDPDQDRASQNCLDDKRTVATVADIFGTKKIPVYVVGIGAEVNGAFRTTLEAMAVAGGRPRTGGIDIARYYSARTATELTGALTSIRDGVASCTYLTPSAPTDPNAIAVTVGGQTILRDASHTDGWDWVDQSYGQLQFFGPACDALTSDAGNVTVSGVVRCE